MQQTLKQQIESQIESLYFQYEIECAFSHEELESKIIELETRLN